MLAILLHLPHCCWYLILVSVAGNKKLSTVLVQNMKQLSACLIFWGSCTAAHHCSVRVCIHSSLDKVLFAIQGAQRNWELEARGQKSRRLGRKISGTWMLWLGSWSDTIPYFWHIPMSGYMHTFVGVDSVQESCSAVPVLLMSNFVLSSLTWHT